MTLEQTSSDALQRALLTVGLGGFMGGEDPTTAEFAAAILLALESDGWDVAPIESLHHTKVGCRWCAVIADTGRAAERARLRGEVHAFHKAHRHRDIIDLCQEGCDFALHLLWDPMKADPEEEA